MHEIERITFLVHPYCYAESLGNPTSMPETTWRAYHEHENAVAARWYETMDRMDERDVVVYHPCYQSAEEKALAEHGRQQLGDRFLTVKGRAIGHPQGFTPETLAALAPEIDEAFRVRGKYTWYAHDLRIAVFSYHYAQDILKLCAERGLRFQPEHVTLKAFGESFEGCVTTWSTMVSVYLDILSRVEIPYEMAVPDTFFLLESRYVKRVSMPHDVALYLFINSENQPIAYYKRERVRLADPTYYTRLGVDAGGLSVRTKLGETLLPPGGELTSAVPPSLVRRSTDGVDIMVASGRGRGGEGPPYYPREAPLFIVAQDLAPEIFFAIAEQAEIVPES